MCCAVLCWLQAATNFNHELVALRRSFRDNEYQEMEAPANFIARVGCLGRAAAGRCCYAPTLRACKQQPQLSTGAQATTTGPWPPHRALGLEAARVACGRLCCALVND